MARYVSGASLRAVRVIVPSGDNAGDLSPSPLGAHATLPVLLFGTVPENDAASSGGIVLQQTFSERTPISVHAKLIETEADGASLRCDTLHRRAHVGLCRCRCRY